MIKYFTAHGDDNRNFWNRNLGGHIPRVNVSSEEIFGGDPGSEYVLDVTWLRHSLEVKLWVPGKRQS